MPGEPTDLEKNIDAVLENDGADYGDEDFASEDGDTEEEELDTTDEGPELPDSGDEEEPELPLDTRPDARQADPENPKGFQRVGKLFADGKGNIVNKNGKIMATAGEAARHWMDMSRQVAAIPNLQRQVSHLNQQAQQNVGLLEKARDIASLPQKLGLNESDFNEAMGILAKWRSDPVGTARDVVSRTIALGHNVSDILGRDAGDALEMGAIRQLVNEMTRGQRERESNEAAATQRNNAIVARYNSFMARYPDAAVHEQSIAHLMNTHGLQPEEAYHEVKYFALQHNLDFTQPLGPQIQARQRNGNGQRSTRRAPMVPSGGRMNNNTATEPNMADANSSWSQILSTVMREGQ